MSATINLPRPSATHAGGNRTIQATGSTVGEVFDDMSRAYPKLAAQLTVPRRRAARLRERVRRRRGHPVPRRSRHAGRRPDGDHDPARGGRRMTILARARRCRSDAGAGRGRDATPPSRPHRPTRTADLRQGRMASADGIGEGSGGGGDGGRRRSQTVASTDRRQDLLEPSSGNTGIALARLAMLTRSQPHRARPRQRLPSAWTCWPHSERRSSSLPAPRDRMVRSAGPNDEPLRRGELLLHQYENVKPTRGPRDDDGPGDRMAAGGAGGAVARRRSSRRSGPAGR
jgi:hypothetical protein